MSARRQKWLRRDAASKGIHRRGIGLTSALVILGVLTWAGLAFASDETPTQQEAQTAPVTESEAVELPAKRTATSDTFELPNGSREARIYQSPVNYRDDEGNWQPIDEGLVGKDGSALSNGDHSFDLTLPAQLGVGPVRLATDDAWVAATLLGAPSAPVDLEDGTASYELPNPEASIELSSLPNGLKEDIEIASASAPSTFHFELTASAGVTPTLTNGGAIEFHDQDDDLVATLPSPFMFDSSGGLDGISDAVEYKLEPNDSGAWLLTVEASEDWLSEPGRDWPVTIDPTLLVSTASYFDCTVYSAPAIETWNKCAQNGVPTLAAEAYNRPTTPDEYSRALTFFRLIGGPIPTNAYVASADMHLYSGEAAQNTDGVELTRLTVPWSSYVSWKYSGYPNCYTCAPWATPGGTGSEVVGEVTTAARGGSAAGWWNIPLQEKMVQDWVSGGEPVNFGVAVKQLGEKVHSCSPTCLYRKLSFESSAASNPSRRPYLLINYWPKAPESSKLTSPTEGTITARRLKLATTWSGGAMSGITYQWREGKEGPFKTIPAALVRDKNNQTVTWPQNAGTGTSSEPLYFDAAMASPALEEHGGTVQIRAIFDGAPVTRGYSAPVEAIVNRFTGSAADATAEVGPGSVDLLTGNLTVTRSDVSVPGFNSTMSFTRAHNSRGVLPGPGQPGFGEESKAIAEENKGVLGLGWKPGIAVEAEGGSEWRNIRKESFIEEVGGVQATFAYAILTSVEGIEVPFEELPIGSGTYIAPPALTGWSLNSSGTNLALADPNGISTKFERVSASNEYVPSSVSYPGASSNKAQMVYDLVEGRQRLKMMIAPAPVGVSCVGEEALATPGCKALVFNYAEATKYGAPNSYGTRVASIQYYNKGAGVVGQEVARYNYNAEGRLTEEWDPRISPALKETYSYTSEGQLATLTLPGQNPWQMEYGPSIDGEQANGRLKAVSRASLLPSPNNVAKTTIAYGVPLAGGVTGLADLSPAAVGQWGQQDLPAEATAVFPPDSGAVATPPASYSQATVYYMNAEGRGVNRATPAGAGTVAGSITTSEYDEFGNVVRELSAQNRLRALGAGSESAAKSHELETKRRYNADGTQMEEEWGPLHQVRLELGTTTNARFHKLVKYNEGWAGTGINPHLPTWERTSALLTGSGTDADQRLTETKYNWNLFKPEETIVDPAGLNIRSVTVYDEKTGLPIERRQPKNKEGGGAGTTKTVYWTKDGSAGCPANVVYAGLPCMVFPAAQAVGAGRPELPVKTFAAYNPLGQPTEIREESGGVVRKTTLTYDSAGRQLTEKIEGGGASVPKVEQTYDPNTGLPAKSQFVSEGAGAEPQYVSSVGASGTGNGQFTHPADIAIDAKGNLWVADQGNNRIQELNEKGEFVKAFGVWGTGNGQFKAPKSIAFDSKGNYWVADSGNNRLEQFNEKGEFLKAVGSAGSGNGQFKGPEGIAIDPSGNIWVADTYNNRIQKLNEKGEFVKVVNPGAMGAIEPTGIDVGPGGNVWIADWANNRVVELSEAGEFVRAFGSEGTGNGQFKRPDSIAADGNGTIWVSDQNNGRVQGFNEKGEYRQQFGSAGSGAGQFGYPSGIAVDSSGRPWVIDAPSREKRTAPSAPAGPTAAYGLDENTGTVARDGAMHHDGAIQYQSWVEGKYGKAVKFDGEGTCITVPDGVDLQLSGSFTLSAWVKPANLTQWAPIFFKESESFYSYSLFFGAFEAGHVQGYVAEKAWESWAEVESPEKLTANTWAHVAMTSDATTLRLYVNGKQVDSASAKAVTESKGPLQIGCWKKEGQYFNGTIDNVRIYNRALSAAELETDKATAITTVIDGDRIQKWTAPFDSQATSATYDSLGRVTEYEDADGNVAKTTFDLNGRPVTFSNAKGSQTLTYDPTSGLLTKLEDSGAGTFTAAYDADGNLTERTLPNGLTAKTTFNEAGESTHLTYTKASSCGTSCTWYDEGIERSIYGQDLSQTGTLANYLYTYDKAGRLTSAAETPAGGGCTTRSYTFDADSNRLSMATRSPGVGGVCNWSGGTPQTYKYDAADRLEGPTYDSWGRVESLPAEFAAGKALTTEYFSTDMVAKQTQNGVTNTFQLDSSLRQRQRVQAGGIEGVEIFHYDDGSDSMAWTQLGSTWTRNIVGIGGNLCGVEDSSSGTTLRLTNLHGDVVGSASLNPAESKLIATFRFDEFGNPMSGNAGRFGWLGGKLRRTELPSGVVQMGARSYVPSIGRFISADAVPGGSANNYDYGSADPINSFDLDGTTVKKGLSSNKAVSAVQGGSRPVAPPASAPAPALSAPVPSASASGVVTSIVSYLKSLAGIVAPIAWGTCVPESEIGPDKQAVKAAFGRKSCIPKLKYHVSSPAQLPAVKASAWAWCVATNAWARNPIKGAWSFLGAAILAGAWCSASDERAWAYVTFY
ncbi:MAG TPA: LamG-like jellyroll fold domain-containing protein [Solirubrobacterales bacterium]|nr:LamG-like jellyroll fold domain-containing protein [Solirubrobacterales bacterium]